MTGVPMSVQFAGLKELKAALKGLEPKMQKRVLRRVLRKQSKTVLAAIKSRMPKSANDDGKHLVDALKVRAGKGSKGYMTDGVAFPERSEIGIDANDPYYWPFALEYGHASAGRGVYRGKGKKSRRQKSAPKDVAPRPYIRQAWDSNEALMAASIDQDTWREIEKMWTSKK